jgi:predicted ATP-grasp superfamily ATP-dependent carboligase
VDAVSVLRSDRLRILLSEGSSTSARQAITALGINGHHIEICDPDAHCLGRFSRYVRKFHRCPGLRDHPGEYLSFVLDLIVRRPFDVLLPIHEQGLLFAKMRARLEPRIAVALPSFESYRTAHAKAGFSRLLRELDLPQPGTRLIKTASDLQNIDRFPCVIKTSIGTASRGTWIVQHQAELERVVRELAGADGDEILVQDFVAGPLEQAQAIFQRGSLLASHAYRRLAAGAGGGPSRKESVRRPLVHEHLARIGVRLAWHGALSVDYIWQESEASPLYIDCNPRLVEPMNAFWSGLDLTQLLLDVSRGQVPPPAAQSRPGTRTHIAIQALLGRAMRRPSRRELLQEFRLLVSRHGPYAGSREELTPLRLDWLSIVPLMVTFLVLLINPLWAHDLVKRGWGAHLLSPQTIRTIETLS